MKIKTLIAIFVMAVVFTNCKKEPIKGDKGDKGESGNNGINGTNGTNGNANIISTTSFTVTNFVYYSSVKEYQSNLTLSAINQSVVTSGVVMVYLTDGSTNASLPYNDGTSTLTFSFYLGGITLNYFNNNYTVPSNPNNLYVIRAVVIPPAIVKSNPSVNWKNYSEVKQKLNLKD